MRAETPSRTAAWVAAARGLASRLPAEARLADDPYGIEFADDLTSRAMLQSAHHLPVPVSRVPALGAWVLYMQVRTRVLDDAVRAFVRGGGRQLVLLGAGYDCRALRLPEVSAVFEVDHPATQGHKRAVLDRLGARSPAHYVTWNFEERPLSELPDALADAGHDRTAPTLTIWEGVTMYLTEGAIDASLRAIRAWSAPGSQLAMTYFTRSRVVRPSLRTRAVQLLVSRAGEPWRWGWHPDELPAYLAARDWHLARDVTMTDAAVELLPPAFARKISGGTDRRIALANAPESIAVASRA